MSTGGAAQHPQNGQPFQREVHMGSPDALMTAEQLAREWNVPKSWIYAASREGRIPTLTLGRYRRYRRSAVEAYLNELETGG